MAEEARTAVKESLQSSLREAWWEQCHRNKAAESYKGVSGVGHLGFNSAAIKHLCSRESPNHGTSGLGSLDWEEPPLPVVPPPLAKRGRHRRAGKLPLSLASTPSRRWAVAHLAYLGWPWHICIRLWNIWTYIPCSQLSVFSRSYLVSLCFCVSWDLVLVSLAAFSMILFQVFVLFFTKFSQSLPELICIRFMVIFDGHSHFTLRFLRFI